MSRPRSFTEFIAWNEEMVARFDPDAYHTRSALPVRLLERMRVRAVVRALGAEEGMRVLEVGCGAGNLLHAIGAVRFGLDLSPSLLAKARGRLGKSAPLVRGDGAHLPFRAASFDRVFCSEVLEHVLQPEAVIAEMRRVLRPGGWAVVSVPNEPLINAAKRWAFRLPFGRRVLQGNPAGYQVSERMEEEWHLHEFELKLLAKSVRGVFALAGLQGVPYHWFALRHVAQLTPL